MDGHYILRVFVKPIENDLTSLHQSIQERGVVVQPFGVVSKSVMKLKFLNLIVLLFRQINDPPIVIVILREHLSHFMAAIAV